MIWLIEQTVRRAPARLLLAAVAVAFPVATLTATALFVDDSARSMTRVALEPVQVDQRALATSLDVDPHQVAARLRGAPGVRDADVFSAADVVLSAPGEPNRVSARLFAVDESYLKHHPWVHVTGDLSRGVLINAAVADAPGFGDAPTLTVELKGDAAPLGLTLPVAGRADLREAAPTWFAIPYGEVQGDVAVMPRAVVIDDATFRRAVLPALQKTLGGATAVTNPGLSELPPASLEVHVTVDRDAYPADPYQAAAWSGTERRVLERRVPGDVLLADNAAEPLTEAGIDAVDAKILFLLLGLPGVLVAAALGLGAAAALAEAHRTDEALLRLRGATDAQLVRLAVEEGMLAGLAGTLVGLLVAGLAVSTVTGHSVWRGLPLASHGVTLLLALVTGVVVTATRIVPLVRAGRRSSLSLERRALAVTRPPLWRRAHLDAVALLLGLTILGGNLLTGGLKPTPIEGPALALAFYVLLAPVALWFAVVLLVVRGLMLLLGRWGRPDRPRPLASWPATALRWLSRRPARTAAALVLGSLAVAFGTQVATFVATYGTAKRNDATAAFGADLRFEPATDRIQDLPALGPEVAATTPIRFVPARAGSDRKTVMAIDPESYPAAARGTVQVIEGGGLDALARTPDGVLVAPEIADGFAVRVGDTLPVTAFPDDLDLSAKLDLRVVGVFRAVPPTDPPAELVVTAATIPAPVPAPDLYLARVAAGSDPEAVARELNQGDRLGDFSAVTSSQGVRTWQRTLTALNLGGLSRIVSVAAAAIASIGVGLLGALLVLERKREFALLRMIGAGRRQILTPPAIDAAVAVVGSLLIGIPTGVALAELAVRVLGLFFTLPPPHAEIPVTGIAVLAVSVTAGCGLAFALALRRIMRTHVASLLREP